MNTLEQYVPILLFFLIALSFPIITLAVARIFRAQRADAVKAEPYECGIQPGQDRRQQQSVHFYLIAVLFVVFDVETIFLFPWAILYQRLALFGLIEMGLFIAILLIGYFYALKKGALRWAS